MSYRNVEDSLTTQIQSISGFGTANVTQGRFAVLSEGVGSACVISYERFRRTEEGFHGYANAEWTITVNLYVRYIDDAAMHSAAAQARTAIIDRINQYPKLGGTANILDAVALEGSARPELVRVGTESFHHETISVLATEMMEFTPQE